MQQIAAPLGVIALALAGGAPALSADGKAVYERTCAACHATGVGGAPPLGDKRAWAPRLASGNAALMRSVLKGKGAMPPMAKMSNLTQADIKAAVGFMIAASN